MTTKTFLTSALAMGFIAPVMAAPTNTGTFPSGGLMQADYTYTNAATSTNMDGVYEGTVNAVAEYTDILYNIAAGNYLAAGSDATNGTECPAGSWCPGLTDALYNATDNQGINSCSTTTDGIYALSTAGASSQNDCYRTCTTADVEHSAGVTGGYYYGNNNQCGATSCVNGWHLKSGISGSELATAIGTGAGENRAHIKANGTFGEQNYDGQGAKGQAYYGLTDNNTWAVDYGINGMLVGQGRCSTQAGVEKFRIGMFSGVNSSSDVTITSNLTDETGQEGAINCYCNVTGYKDGSGNMQSLSSPWVLTYVDGNVPGCASYCANYCARYLLPDSSDNLAFRALLVGSATGTGGLASCEANTITINWTGTSTTEINANNAGTATYGSDIRTPRSAEHVPGKTFTGWRFVDPTKVSVGQ